MFEERGFEVDHSTINRWVLSYAPMTEKRLRQFRRPHCGSVRIDETYVKIRGKWRYLYRAIDKHGNPVDFLLSAKRDLEAAKRFFRKTLKDQPLLSPNKICTDGANTFPSAIKASVEDGLLQSDPVHYVTKHLQQGIESDHFRVKKNMPKIGGFQSFNTARRTIAGFEAMLWLRKGFGFSGGWTINDPNDLVARLFGRHLEPNLEAVTSRRPYIAQKVRDRGVASRVAPLAELSKQSTARQARIGFYGLPKIWSKRVDDCCPRHSWTIGWSLKAPLDVFAHRLAIDARFSGNSRHCQPLLMQIQDHDRLPQLDHQNPPSDHREEYRR